MTNNAGFQQTNEVGVFVWRSADFSEAPAFLGGDDLAAGQRSIIGTLEQALGTREPIYAPSATRRGQIDIVGTITGAPELPSLQLNEHIDPNSREYLDTLKEQKCLIDMAIAAGKCGSPDNLGNWSKIYLVAQARANNLSYSEFQNFEAQQAVMMLEGTLDALRYGIVLPVTMGRKADSTVLAEVIDGIIIDDPSCGDCKPYEVPNAGLFAVANDNAGSPGLPAQIVYSIRQGVGSFNTVNVNSLSGSNAPSALIQASRYLMVLSETDDAHHIAEVSRFTNVAPLNPFSRVSTGYVSSNGPRAAWAQSPRRILIAGENGYIYLCINPATGVTVLDAGNATTEDANAVSGAGANIAVIAYNNNVLVYSTDYWSTWNSLTGPEVSANLTALQVFDRYNWAVGTSTGKWWLTTDGGETWTQVILPGQSSITAIDDVSFSPTEPNVGVMAVTTATGGVILRTFSGGREWYDTAPAIAQASDTGTNYNFVATGGYNVVWAGGLDATDGMLALGVGA
jgi:hypothetical protein